MSTRAETAPGSTAAARSRHCSAERVTDESCTRDIEPPQRLQNIVPRRLRSVFYHRLTEAGKVDSYRPKKPGFRQPVKVLAPRRPISRTGVDE